MEIEYKGISYNIQPEQYEPNDIFYQRAWFVVKQKPMNKSGANKPMNTKFKHDRHEPDTKAPGNGCVLARTFIVCSIPAVAGCVKHTRGAHKSKPISSIIQEAEHQISMGAQELVLIAEDTTITLYFFFTKLTIMSATFFTLSIVPIEVPPNLRTTIFIDKIYL